MVTLYSSTSPWKSHVEQLQRILACQQTRGFTQWRRPNIKTKFGKRLVLAGMSHRAAMSFTRKTPPVLHHAKNTRETDPCGSVRPLSGSGSIPRANRGSLWGQWRTRWRSIEPALGWRPVLFYGSQIGIAPSTAVITAQGVIKPGQCEKLARGWFNDGSTPQRRPIIEPAKDQHLWLSLSQLVWQSMAGYLVGNRTSGRYSKIMPPG